MAAAFGYSRQAYYQAAAALAESGLDGLVLAKPGPRGGHKLTGEILAWAEHLTGALSRDQPGRAAAAQRARRLPPYQSLLLRTGSLDATPPTRIAFP